MTGQRQLSLKDKEEPVRRFGTLLSRRSGVVFARVHGSFLEPVRGIEDIGIAVWVDLSKVKKETELDYHWGLSSWLGKGVPYAMDAQALSNLSLGFKYAASGGRLLWAKDPVSWYDFREQTWEQYLDFAPLARRVLWDRLGSRTE